MAGVMMALSDFRFELASAAYQTLRRSDQWAWTDHARIGREAAQQYTGVKSRTISLNGVIYPQFKGGLKQIEAIRAEADKGTPLLMTDGLGFVLGKWVITDFEHSNSFLMEDGRPRKVTFRISLRKYGDDA